MVKLRFSMSGSEGDIDDFAVEFLSSEHKISIGRSASNDWVLPDDSKVLSGVHAVVSSRGRRVFLEDTSTNGVFANFSSKPVGRGNSIELQNGDSLIMGEYEVKVAVSFIEKQLENTAEISALVNPADEHKATLDPLDLLERVQEKPRTVADILSSGELGPAVLNTAENSLDIERGDRAHDILSGGRDNSQAVKGSFQAPRQAGKSSAELIKMSEPEALTDCKRRPPEQLLKAADTTPEASESSLREVEEKSTLLKPFFDALGIDQPAMPPEDMASLMGEAGAALAEVMTGLSKIADAPSRLSEEFGVGRPRLHPVEDNPLKSPRSAAQLADAFFGRHRRQSLLPSAAFRESLSEVADHQTALLAAVRSAYAALLPCFEPRTLEDRFSRYGGAQAKGVEADAWMWDMYQRYYADLVREERQGLARLFSDVFGRAYHEHMATNASVARAATEPTGRQPVSGGIDDLSAMLGNSGGSLL